MSSTKRKRDVEPAASPGEAAGHKGKKSKWVSLRKPAEKKEPVEKKKKQSKSRKSRKKGKKKHSENQESSQTGNGKGKKKDVDLTKEAGEYIELWSKARESWKFNKKTQTYLLKHCYDPAELSKENFPAFLQYIDGLQGHARSTSLKKAQEILNVEELAEEEDANNDDALSDDIREAVKRQKKLRRIRLARANAIARILS
jgi:hypothetical protein